MASNVPGTTTTQGIGRRVWIASSGVRSRGEVRIQTWSVSARLRRAGKVLGVAWGLAIVSVFVPGLHFFLVPAFLVAGPIAAFVVGRQRSAVLGGEGTCPGCHAALVIVGGCADRWPLHDVCVHCRRQLEIEDG